MVLRIWAIDRELRSLVFLNLNRFFGIGESKCPMHTVGTRALPDGP